MLQCVSPKHGRILIYVWAIEQDELSKRAIPQQASADELQQNGEDVFVPWVLPKQQGQEEPQVFNRYYHMFARGELRDLVVAAAHEEGLQIGPRDESMEGRGMEIVQDGWERSNYFVELRLWKVENLSS